MQTQTLPPCRDSPPTATLQTLLWGRCPCVKAVSSGIGFPGMGPSEPLLAPSLQMREREVKLWDTRHFSSALTSITLDTSPG